jgi:hypothetical protein
MIDNIVALTGRPVGAPTGEPDRFLVEVLEDLLERAKSGQIVGMAAVFLEHDGQSAYDIVGRVGGFTMAGALAAAVHTVNAYNVAESQLGD